METLAEGLFVMKNIKKTIEKVVHFKKNYIFGEYGSIIRQSEKIKAGKK